jgi:hypothetical protein
MKPGFQLTLLTGRLSSHSLTSPPSNQSSIGTAILQESVVCPVYTLTHLIPYHTLQSTAAYQRR